MATLDGRSMVIDELTPILHVPSSSPISEELSEELGQTGGYGEEDEDLTEEIESAEEVEATEAISGEEEPRERNH